MTKSKLILSPMAGFTDAPFRLLARRCGADFAVTEMVSSVAMSFGDLKTGKLAFLPSGDSPASVQLFGHDPFIMAKAALMLVTREYPGCQTEETPSAIDVNMGCPVKKIAGSGDGSALMASPSLCGEIVAAMNEALFPYGVPVTVKIRAGLDAGHINAVEVARACAAAGASAVTVHARTREEMYRPGIRPEVIREVREALPETVAVYGNGDITCAADAVRMLRETGCDGVAVGRAALGDPWIFREIKAAISGEEYTPPTTSERIDTAVSLVRDIVAEKGEFSGIHEARGRAAHFIRGLPGAAAARDRLNRTESLDEFIEIISSLKEV